MLYLSGTFQACKGLKTASLLSFFLHKDESTSSSQMRFFFLLMEDVKIKGRELLHWPTKMSRLKKNKK